MCQAVRSLPVGGRVGTVSEPFGYLARIEPDEPANLEVGDPFLGDQAAHVTHGDAEPFGELVDGQ
jgi:hypothetical protein